MKALEQCWNITDLKELARRRLPAPVFDFMEGGADDEWTAQRNTEAFAEYRLVPRVLVDVAKVDTSTRILGQRISSPFFISPTGGSRLFHPQGEKAVARAAARAGILYSLATFSTVSIEDLAAASEGPKVFQLYLMRDSGLNTELVRRCRAAGYAALCITVDCPVSGNRERDHRNGLAARPRRLGLKTLLSLLARPAWLWHFLQDPHIVPATFCSKKKLSRADSRSLAAFVQNQLTPSATWEDAASLIRQWQGPFAIKGILNAEDAKRAADMGASAIMVSNHGGRQLDGAIASINALPRIVEAVGDRVEIIVDGGIRRGAHVLKALALGAKACSVGRPYLYGLAAGGEAGVDRALQILHSEVERDMRLLGCSSISEIDGRYISFRPARGDS